MKFCYQDIKKKLYAPSIGHSVYDIDNMVNIAFTTSEDKTTQLCSVA